MEATHASCPRCGYDLSGITESWQESCPLDGVCSECGLELRWREVMRPDEFRTPGFYEHARGVAFFSACRTWLWTMLPWVFWRKVRLDQPVRVRRMLLWILVLLLPLQLLHAAHVIATRVWSPWFAIKSGSISLNWLGFPGGSSNASGPSAATGSAPYAIPQLPIDWEGAASEALKPFTHTGFGYPVSWPANGTRAGPPRVTFSVLFANVRPGWEGWPLFGLPLLTLWAMLPLMFVVLPQTRARAKVRFVHLVRAWVYSSSWIVLLGVLRIACEALDWLQELGRTPGPYIPNLPGIPILGNLFRNQAGFGRIAAHPWWTMAVIAAWLGLWWALTLKRGFRVQEWRAVWFAIAIPSLLASLIALIATSRDTAAWIDRQWNRFDGP